MKTRLDHGSMIIEEQSDSSNVINAWEQNMGLRLHKNDVDGETQ